MTCRLVRLTTLVKMEIPAELRDKIPSNGRKKQMKIENMVTPSSVFFVPNSHKGILINNLKNVAPLLTRLTGYRVHLVESGGTPLSRLFSLDSGKCHRADCPVCKSHTGKERQLFTLLLVRFASRLVPR